MTTPMLADAFGHHVWATSQLIDVCAALSEEQLATGVPGTYGSILGTMRHLVGEDAWDVFTLSADRADLVDTDHMDLAGLRDAIERNGARWSSLLAQDLDPDAVVTEIDDDDGFRRDAPVAIRFAAALQHGTDHRSQICTALTALDIKPPKTDLMNYGVAVGRVVEILPT
jgi:uncharacterized damage-inducible protein DinB